MSVSLFLTTIASQAQRVFEFKAGQEYEMETSTISNATLRRGKQTLGIKSVTSATKNYKVTSAGARFYDFDVEIKKMDIDLDALGKKMQYKSGTRFDSTSTILKALDFMVKKPIHFVIDKNGIIQSSTNYKAEMATDTLVSFAGIQPEVFTKQTLLSMLADITYNRSLTKGFTWTDSVEVNKQKSTTKFTIEEVNETFTIVKFTNSTTSKMLNTNTNGSYVIENSTGLITEKVLYSISVGYMISAGNTLYAVSRSSNVTEKLKRIK